MEKISAKEDHIDLIIKIGLIHRVNTFLAFAVSRIS